MPSTNPTTKHFLPLDIQFVSASVRGEREIGREGGGVRRRGDVENATLAIYLQRLGDCMISQENDVNEMLMWCQGNNLCVNIMSRKR